MTKSLLLCDDEIHILRATEFKLSKAGYEVRCAADGLEALEAMEAQCPDLVITDLNMPRMDGLKLVGAIRADERFAHVPVVMLTAKGYEVANDVICQEYRVAHVMTKPFSPRELLSLVQSIVDGPDAQAQAQLADSGAAASDSHSGAAGERHR